MKTFMANPAKIDRKWYVVDAEGKTLGRLASEVAKVLRGKNKPEYTPHVDTGDYVIVVNAEKIHVTGKKLDQKIYYHHSDKISCCRIHPVYIQLCIGKMCIQSAERIRKFVIENPVFICFFTAALTRMPVR